MRTNYMMTVDDVMEELGVKRSKAYSILKQLNDELAKEGYVAVRGKIPRPYWETKFYGLMKRTDGATHCMEIIICQTWKSMRRNLHMGNME